MSEVLEAPLTYSNSKSSVKPYLDGYLKRENSPNISRIFIMATDMKYIKTEDIPNMFGKWRDRVKSFITNTENFDEHDLPNQESVSMSIKFIDVLENISLEPTQVNPSPEGGIIFEFQRDNEYKMVEIYNDGDLVYLHRTPVTREATDFNSFNNFVRRIPYLF